MRKYLTITAIATGVAIAGLAEPVQAGRVPRGYHCSLGQIWRPSMRLCQSEAHMRYRPIVRRVVTKTRVVVRYVTRIVNRTVVIHEKPAVRVASTTTTTAPEAMLARLPYGGLPKLVHANMHTRTEFKLPPLEFQK